MFTRESTVYFNTFHVNHVHIKQQSACIINDTNTSIFSKNLSKIPLLQCEVENLWDGKGRGTEISIFLPAGISRVLNWEAEGRQIWFQRVHS